MTDTFDDLEIPPFLRRQDPSPRKGEEAPLPPAPIVSPGKERQDEHDGDEVQQKPIVPAHTEPTDQGLQFVIPGCEKDQSRKRGQLELF